jgi:lipoprotein-releasing system permease protein
VRPPGFQWFVAWRYLMARPRRLSGTILVFTAVFAAVVVAAAFALGLQPLTDNFIASGLPLPLWAPTVFGVGMALVVVFPYALAIKMGWLPQRGPTRADLERAAGGLAGRKRAARRKVIVGAVWMAIGAAVTAISYQMARAEDAGGVYLVAYGPVLFGLVQIVWGVAEYFDTGDVHARFVRAPAWGRHGGAAVFFAGIAGVAGAAAGGGADVLIPGAVCLAVAPLIVILSGASLSPRAVSMVIPVLVALGGLIAVAAVALASNDVGEGELFDNLPGLIDTSPAWLSPVVLIPLAVAVLALGAAAARRTWRSRAIPVAALFVALVPAAIAFVFWWRLTGYGLGELEMSGSGIDYHYPMWLTLPGGIGAALMVLSLHLLALRYFFTFFTTVSIGGVMIGSMALVITLSVMSGFETDLRQKILGSNAHVLVTREDEAPFTEYRDVMQKVERTRGVVALTPYLSSEVVIAGASNYFNVVIKGIDPRKIARVTNLGEDLEDADSLDRMYPLHGDAGVAGPPPDAAPSEAPGDTQTVGGPDASDPAPSDLDVGDVPPTDWSGGETESPAEPEPEVVDPAPEDLEVGEAEPTDWSGGETESPEPEPPPVADAGPGSEPLIEEPDDAVDRHEPAGKDEVRVGGDWSEPLEREIPPEVAILPGVLVGRELVKQINLYLGQEVKVISPLGQNTLAGQTPYIKPYRVAGVFFTGMYEYDLKLIYVELSTLQDFLDLPDVVTGIEIRVDDPEDTEAVVRQLRTALGPVYRIQDWKELNRSLFSALKLEKIAMFLVLAIIILVASFSIVGNLIMVVVEKAREIAVLKTLGASDSGVTRIFSVQGFFIGLVGTAIGVYLGLGACLFADTYGIGIPPDVYYIDRLPVHVDMWSVLQVGAAGLLISVAATIYPAQIASRLRPVEGLRYE